MREVSNKHCVLTSFICYVFNRNGSAQVCELLSNTSLFVGQFYKDKSLALCACNLILTTDLKNGIITHQFTASTDLFLN